MTACRTSSAALRRRGFTLIEGVICVVLVAVMLTAALQMLGASARIKKVQADQSRGMALARQLLAEIMQLSYEDPGDSPIFGPESGQTRSVYDDVDDFNGWQESPPQLRDGTTIAGFTGWKRSVKVEWANAATPGTTSATESGLKRITVTVTSPTGKVTTLVGLRSQSSAYEKDLNGQSTYLSWVGVTLQTGSDSNARVTTSVNPVNQVP